MDSSARDAFVDGFDPSKRHEKAEETTVLSLSIPVRVKDQFSSLQDLTNKEFGAELKAHIIAIILGCHAKTFKARALTDDQDLISGV